MSVDHVREEAGIRKSLVSSLRVSRGGFRYQGRKTARKTNKGELEERIFCHVTKPAVNNADGQCCELRWYQSHKWRGFMLAARRETRPATQGDHSLLRVMSVHQTATLSRNRRASLIVQGYRYFLLRFSVFEWSALRFHDTLVIFDRDLSPFRQPRATGETITLPRSKPSNGIRWQTLANSPLLLRCFYPACSWMRKEWGDEKSGDENGRKIQRWNLQSAIAWSRYLYCPAGVTYQASARVSGSATDKSTELWRIMEGLSTIK